jgi:hypothetical protein
VPEQARALVPPEAQAAEQASAPEPQAERAKQPERSEELREPVRAKAVEQALAPAPSQGRPATQFAPATQPTVRDR